MLSKIVVSRLMTPEVITTTPDTTIEEAAYLMVVKRVGGLPVVDDNNYPIGMITETDIFRTLVDMFSGGSPGLRLTLTVPRGKGVLAPMTRAILDMGGDILSVGAYQTSNPKWDGLVLKIKDVSKDQIVDTLEALGDQVIDAREVE